MPPRLCTDSSSDNAASDYIDTAVGQAAKMLQVHAMSLLCLSNDGFALAARQTMTRTHVGSSNPELAALRQCVTLHRLFEW